jgi:hypothetical protein
MGALPIMADEPKQESRVYIVVFVNREDRFNTQKIFTGENFRANPEIFQRNFGRQYRKPSSMTVCHVSRAILGTVP